MPLVKRSTRTKRLFFAFLVALSIGGALSIPVGDGVICAICAATSPSDPLWWVYLCYLCPGGGNPNGS